MKKPLLISILLFILLVPVISTLCTRVGKYKTAIHENEIVHKGLAHIMVQIEFSTGTGWILTDCESGPLSSPQEISLVGNVPNGFDYEVECGENTFVCFGSFSSEDNSVFIVEEWEILYPVKRRATFFPNWMYPKSGLYWFDRP